jgi:hypothetical protein
MKLTLIPAENSSKLAASRRTVSDRKGPCLGVRRSVVALKVIGGAEHVVNAMVGSTARAIVVTHCMVACTSKGWARECVVGVCCTGVDAPHSEEDRGRQFKWPAELNVQSPIRDVAEV